MPSKRLPDWASLVAQTVKSLPVVQETRVRSLVQDDPLEKEMATHSSILAWKIPWVEEFGRSCPALCDPMNRSMPGLPVHH